MIYIYRSKANDVPDLMQLKFLINYRLIIEKSKFSINNKVPRYIYLGMQVETYRNASWTYRN